MAPGAQQKRLAAYLDGLAQAAGHADREEPLQAYCTGSLIPGERKSVEPMAAGWLPTTRGGPTNRCTTWWRMRPAATKRCGGGERGVHYGG